MVYTTIPDSKISPGTGAEAKSMVCLVLDMSDGETEQAALKLQGKPGVMIADHHLEGVPDLLMVVETSILTIAKLVMKALSVLSDVTEDLHLPVTRNN